MKTRSQEDAELTEKQQAVQLECTKGERDLKLNMEIRTRSFCFKDTISLSFINLAYF